MTPSPTITRDDVAAARDRIADRVRETPVLRADREPSSGFGAAGAGLWFKLEHLQHTGSFKARGAFNRVLAAAESGRLPASGVVAASGGNAGLAVAHAAAVVGVPAQVFVPVTAPAVKVARLRSVGAEVVQVGSEYAEAYEAALKRESETGALFCHAYDQPEVCAGQGTLALELDRQTGGVDTVLTACGGGGLTAGVAAALEGVSRVVAVEPERCRALGAALDAGGPVDVGVSGVAADSLGARSVGGIAFSVARRSGVRAVAVGDEEIVSARRLLWERYRIVVEHGAATAYAALTAGAYRPEPEERVAIVLCGANTDPSTVA